MSIPTGGPGSNQYQSKPGGPETAGRSEAGSMSRAVEASAAEAATATSFVELLDAVTWQRVDLDTDTTEAVSVTAGGYDAATLGGLVPADDVDRCAAFARTDPSCLEGIREVLDEGPEDGGVDPGEYKDALGEMSDPACWNLELCGTHGDWFIRAWTFQDFETVTVLVGDHSNGSRLEGHVLLV